MPEGNPPDIEEYRRKARGMVGRPHREAGSRPRKLCRDSAALLAAPISSANVLRAKGGSRRSSSTQATPGSPGRRSGAAKGFRPSTNVVFNEEASGYRLPHFGAAHAPTMGVCAGVMQAHGSATFLANHMSKILAGEELWCQFFSEPSVGSDLAGITTWRPRRDRRILNGSKVWTTGAFLADYGFVLPAPIGTCKAPRTHRFAVKIDQPGVEVLPIRKIDDAAEFCQEFFTDVELTDDDIVGELNHGWTVAQTMLVLERGSNLDPHAAPSIYGGMGGIGGMALAPDLVALAKRVGRQKDPYVRQQIARASINDFAAGQMFVRIGALMRAGAQPAGVAGYGKLVQGIFQAQRGRLAMEIGRGAVLTWDADDMAGKSTSYRYLNARQLAIAGGTNEVQRNGIGEASSGCRA